MEERTEVSAEHQTRWVALLASPAAVLTAALLCPAALRAQSPMDSSLRVNASDLAVLEARDIRKDLACTVTPVKPEVGFDLRFHALVPGFL